MHIIFQAFNHMYIYISLLRRSMISSTLREIILFPSLKLYKLTIVFSYRFLSKFHWFSKMSWALCSHPHNNLLSSFSKVSTLLSLVNLLSYKVPLTTRSSNWEEEVREITHIVEKISILQKFLERRVTKASSDSWHSNLR